MDPRILECQKQRDLLAAFWPRKVSKFVTALLVKTPITPNQTTVLWAAISAMNSYVIYRVLLGEYYLLPVIPAVYVLTYVLDCVDGEIARYHGWASPIGGKLIDGVSHRVTEYSLLAAYVAASAHITGSPWALPVGLLLISGEAMYTYAYERRLMAMRVHIGFKGTMAAAENVYERHERWADLTLRRKIATIKGQVHYKSVYVVIAVSYISGLALLIGLAALAAYKHFSWIRLVARTLAAAKTAEEQPAPAEPTPALNHTVAGERV
jgi:phosphatidylglycerophosphate synthase